MGYSFATMGTFKFSTLVYFFSLFLNVNISNDIKFKFDDIFVK